MKLPTVIGALLTCVLVAQSANANVTIDQVLPFTPEADSVRIVVQLGGNEAVGLSIDGTITQVGATIPAWQGSIGHIEAGKNGAVEKTLTHLKVRPWSPGSPTLYELHVTVSKNGQPAAEKTIRFGFRKFESKDGHFYLNGHPIFMCGLAINPPGRSIPSDVSESRKFAYDYVKYLRGQHVNLIRLEHDNQDWFDVCDELGMMVYQGFYASPPTGMTRKEQRESRRRALATQAEAENKHLPPDFDKSIDAYKAAFETYVRHPSIVIYILSNEMPYQGTAGKQVHDFLSRAFDRLSKWDHTRLYIGNAGYGEGHEGDVNDVHRYWGWYYNTFLTYYNLRDEKLFGDPSKNQPFTFSECVGNFTGPTGAYNYIERKQLAAALGWSGHASDQPAEAQADQGFMTAQAIESFRRLREINPRISGLMPFTICFHNWRGISSFDQMKPTAAAKQFGISYQPVLLSWERWQPNVYAGAKTSLIAHVINDAEDFSDLKNASLDWELRHGSDAPVLKKTIALPTIAYYATWHERIDIDLPKDLASGDYELVGRIERDGKTISANTTPIFIAASDWQKAATKPADSARKIVVWDDSAGKTSAAIERDGLKVARTIDSLQTLDPAKELLVIGEGAWSKNLSGEQKELKAFVHAGGRVLCLGQPHQRFDTAWLAASIALPKESVNNPAYFVVDRPSHEHMNINPERPEHPAFAGIDRAQLKLWSDTTGWDQSKGGFPDVYPVRYGYEFTKLDDLANVTILADYDQGLEAVALSEIFDPTGEGSVMLCGFELVPRSGVDPIADRMLVNLVNYMASEGEHDIHPTIDKPIYWGNFASEHGALAGPLQGLFRNTIWLTPPTDPNATPLAKDKGSWNSRAGDQFYPRGIRPRGAFHYTFNCAVRDDNKSADGSGEFWVSLPPGRGSVVTTVRNPTQHSATLRVDVNDAEGDATTIAPGETKEIRTPIAGDESNLGVRYTGGKELVILETDFQ